MLIKEIEKQAIYYRKEQKVYKYAVEFWKQLVSYIDIAHFIVHDDILPIHCFWDMEEIVEAVKNGRNTKVTGGMVHYRKNQAVIRIGINCDNDRLNQKLKRTIRHELIHYVLWMMDKSWKDDELDFWCYCYVFDANAYMPLNESDKNKYEIFKKVYDGFLKDIPEWIAGKIIIIILNIFEESENVTEEYIKLVVETEIDKLKRDGILR